MSWIDDPEVFPKIEGKYERTSDEDGEYNCIAWAANCTTEWWSHEKGFKWPGPRTRDVCSLVAVFLSIGYAKCDDGGLEHGYEKVALYQKNGAWQHAARQLPDGKWTSKLGELEDIRHDTAECIEGPDYGTVFCFMKRKRATQS